MRRLLIVPVAIAFAGCPAAPRRPPEWRAASAPGAPPPGPGPDADAGAAPRSLAAAPALDAALAPDAGVAQLADPATAPAPGQRTARAPAQVATAGPGRSPPRPVSIIIPSGPRQTLTSRMIMVGRADGESERITMRLTFEAGTATLVERFDTGPSMFIGGGDRNPRGWKQRRVRSFTGSTALEDGYRRFHLVDSDGRKLELTCLKDAVEALARKVVATQTSCATGCDCETVWDPPQTTQVAGLFCFDPGGVTFQQFFTADKVDWIYENDACVRGDAYRLR